MRSAKDSQFIAVVDDNAALREAIESLSRYSTHDRTIGSPLPGTDSNAVC